MRSNLIEVDLQSETHRVRFDSPIDSVKVDGQKLNDIHDLAVKVDRSSLYIATLTKRTRKLILFLGVIALICLICNIGMAIWVATHDDLIMKALDSTVTRNSQVMDRMARTNNIYAKKLDSLGLRYRDGKWMELN